MNFSIFTFLFLCFAICSPAVAGKDNPVDSSDSASSSLVKASNVVVQEDQPFIVGRMGIHLMWINKEPNQQEFLFPDSQKELAQLAIKSWAAKNPEPDTSLNFWYDSEMATPAALANTSTLFKGILSADQYQKLRIRNIRDLDRVKESPVTFDKRASIYFRSDLLRFIIADACLKEECDTFIYSDLNVTAEDRSYLFDLQTIGFLNQYGFVMLRNDQGPNSHPNGGTSGYENKFMIVRKNEHFMEASRRIIINPSLKILEAYISDQGRSISNLSFDEIGMSQCIFKSIPYLFLYELYLNGRIDCVAKTPSLHNPSMQDPKQAFLVDRSQFIIWMNRFTFKTLDGIGLDEFSLREFTKEYYKLQPNYEHVIDITGSEWPLKVPMPAKRMTAPRSHFG